MAIKEKAVFLLKRRVIDVPVICLKCSVSQSAKTEGQIHVPYSVVHQSPLSTYATGTLTAILVFQLREMAAGAAVIAGGYLVV